MGLFGKLFGGGRGGDAPRKSKAARPPRWARDAFGDNGDRFAVFTEVVRTVVGDAEIDVSDDDIRSGSLTLRNGHEFREWVLDSIARTCSSSPEDRWHELVETDRVEVGFARGRAPSRAVEPGDDAVDAADAADAANGDDARPTEGSDNAWKIGIEPWGCINLQASDRTIVTVALPIVDRFPLAAAKKPDGTVSTLVVCNRGDDGHLAASGLARMLGVEVVHAVERDHPIDRGQVVGDGGYRGDTPGPVEIRALGTLVVGPLRLDAMAGSVIGRWRDGQTVIVGDAIPLSLIGSVKPTFVVGKLVIEKPDDPLAALTALCEVKQLILLDNVVGQDARMAAKLLSMMGASSLVAFGPTTDPASALSRKMQMIAVMIAGDLERADAIAVEGIAANDDVDELTYQRAMIALMRGDDATAMSLLEGVDTPHAQSSRASIARSRGDANATELSVAVLARMPGDPIAIRGAITAYVSAGDLDAARKLLANNRAHLDIEVAIGLDELIAHPDKVQLDRTHVFPAHASLAMEAIEPLVTAKRYAEAEPMLRRIRGWDPGNYAITAELGVVLAAQDRVDAAIAIYDESIARGGGAKLLRFNRGNCLAKRLRLDEAIADYRWCIDIKPDWHEARLGLASALNGRGERAAARAELVELTQRGAPEHYIAALEDLLSR